MTRRPTTIGMVLLASVLLAGCATGNPTKEDTVQAAPTAEHQRRQAADYVEETMRRSGVDWDADQSDEYAQDCVLADGSTGALYNIVRTGAGVDDPEAVTKAVGTAWVADGLKVEYSTDEMTSGAKRYLVNGGGGAVERIQFGAATTKTTMSGVSKCGTGNAADLG
ncbi:MAG: hypothetical protein ACTHMH_15420 [Curtobacterium sp.]|uniref:hypothetical protein n=1 Tax=Curtobacterium sp. A7_M15 TaxID=3065241 RepID=UPI0027379C0B|nr:hypothetical protein [Curtobacterium sp. A7_M15]